MLDLDVLKIFKMKMRGSQLRGSWYLRLRDLLQKKTDYVWSEEHNIFFLFYVDGEI